MRNQKMLLSLASLLLCARVFAAGNYAQSFGITPANWQVINGGWAVTDGNYRNLENAAPPTVAYYEGNTWNTNFTYRVRAYADWPANSNKVGAVFGLTDSTHYYLVLVNMSGVVSLEQVSGGVTTSLATGSVDPAVAGLSSDNWFNLEIFANADRVTVKINGRLAIARAAITPVNGRIGLAARANMGRFDDVQIVDNLATQIFRGTFSKPDGSPIDIGPLHDCTRGTGESNLGEWNCWGSIEGEDASGYSWPLQLWGGEGKLQYVSASTDNDVTTSVEAEIAHLPGRTGSSTDALHQILWQQQTPGHNPQMPYVILPDPAVAQGDLYFRYWIKSDGEFGDWHMPWQFKTQDNSYRVSLFILTTGIGGGDPCARSSGDDTPRFVLRGDHATATPLYWHVCNNSAAVPVNQWFKVEVFFHRRAGAENGRVWVAVNGVEIFDYSAVDGLRAGGNNTSPINRIMFPQSYGGYSWPRDQWVDDVEVWNGFPADAAPH